MPGWGASFCGLSEMQTGQPRALGGVPETAGGGIKAVQPSLHQCLLLSRVLLCRLGAWCVQGAVPATFVWLLLCKTVRPSVDTPVVA